MKPCPHGPDPEPCADCVPTLVGEPVELELVAAPVMTEVELAAFGHSVTVKSVESLGVVSAEALRLWERIERPASVKALGVSGFSMDAPDGDGPPAELVMPSNPHYTPDDEDRGAR